MKPQPLTDEEENRFQMLLMAAIDHELSAEDEREFKRYLAASPDCQREWEEYKKLKEATMQLKFMQPAEEAWDRYWLNVYNRIERGLGWILTSIGAMIVLFYGAYKAVQSILADTELQWFVKAGILAMLGGMVILLVSVLREKLFTRKTDKYKEIQR
jgi:ferric-dicitrate binding protein FerR (iron transport regulator)